ncbi:hypothetical protein V512_014875 [Mesotoga sp. Brook.08.105.5.1]|nr:hypothetical protein V512_014875 [Mesotoga sp. Brook.08.105.5.1]
MEAKAGFSRVTAVNSKSGSTRKEKRKTMKEQEIESKKSSKENNQI